MKNLIQILIILIVFTSCYTAKQAQRDIIKADLNHPIVTSGFCAEKFPVKESVKETIKFLKGETIVKTNTVTVDCDSIVSNEKIDNKVSVKYNTIYRTDTVFKEKIVFQENIAKVSNLELKVKEKDKSIAEKDNKINDLKSDKRELTITSAILLFLLISVTVLFFKK